MTTLTLYSRDRGTSQKVAEWPISPNQAWDYLGEALNAWASVCRSPRAVLSDGKVAHLIPLRGIEVRGY
jgi:hypothetical protein